MALLKMDPNDARSWTEHGFLGGIVVGAAWAIERFLLRKPASDEVLKQRQVTPFDVREEVRTVDRRIDALVQRMDAFISEEHLVHTTIVASLVDGLKEIRAEIRDLRTALLGMRCLHVNRHDEEMK